MLDVRNVTLSFEDEIIFQNLSFFVEKGTKIGLSGPSGSGKSSLLNAILGFVPLREGQIIVDNLQLSSENIQKIRSLVSWLPQELSFKFETVHELFFYPYSFAVNKKLSPSLSQIEQVFSKLKLEKTIINKKLDEISGGQKQRVALASQILMRKPILLMDEPSSALDDESQSAVIELISNEKEITLISASHNKDWLNNMDKIIEINSLSKI